MKIDEVNITVLGAAKVEGAWYIDCRCEVEANNKHSEISINTAEIKPVNVKGGSFSACNKETTNFVASVAGAAVRKLFYLVTDKDIDVDIATLGLVDDLRLFQKITEFNSKNQPQEPNK